MNHCFPGLGEKFWKWVCGTGRLAKPVEELGGEYIGIDPSLKLFETSL